MPLVPGRPLSEILHDQIQLPPEQVAKIIHQIADGLGEVHRQGVLHRDIKPSNILVDSSGAARLTDFGLAEFVHEESSLTATGVRSIAAELAVEYPNRFEYRRLMAACEASLGNCEAMQDNNSKARTHYQASLPVFRQLVKDEPDNSDLRGKLAVTLTNLGLVTPSDERPPLYQEARELLMSLGETSLSPYLARRIAKIDCSEGTTFKELGRIEEAIDSFRSGIEKMRPHVEANPSVGDHRWMLGELMFELAMVIGPTDEGLSQLILAKEHREILYRADPNHIEYKQDIHAAIANLIAFLDQMNRRDEAKELIVTIAALPNASEVYENVATQLAEVKPPVSEELLAEIAKVH